MNFSQPGKSTGKMHMRPTLLPTFSLSLSQHVREAAVLIQNEATYLGGGHECIVSVRPESSQQHRSHNPM